jgi:ABC-2 family transporter protein
MTFLPIVERELRVGARRRFTYWSRLAAAVFALLILVAMYTLAAASRGAIFSAGQGQFAVLKWLSFIFACSAGVFLTADTLSEEKREGTLGLLFLTDLRGHDVVLGKLISTSVVAFYGFLAAFPTLALTMLFGGVTAGEFWRMVLIISNTLFVSISAGLLVSSVSRDAVKAVNAALFVIVLLLGGLPLADLILAGGDATKYQPVFSLASPGYLFWNAGPFMPRDYWVCVAIQNCLGWCMLALCSVFVPRTRQQKIAKRGVARMNWMSGYRSAERRRLLEKNPVLWLAVQDRWLRWLIWVLVLVAVVQFSVAMVEMVNDNGVQMTATPMPGPRTNASTVATNRNGVTYTYSTTSSGTTAVRFSTSRYALSAVSWLLAHGFQIWVALQACRFLVEAIRSGTLELILVSPLGPREVVKGQARALLRIFLIPAVLLLVIQLTTGVQGILEVRQSFARMPPGSAGPFNMVWMQAISLAGGLVNFVTVLLALGWFGMWMGLTTRKVTIAVLKTVVFVIVIPTLAIAFGSGMVFGLIMASVAMASKMGGFPLWLWPLMYCGLNTAKDLVFIFWSRRQLYTRFREVAAMEVRMPIGSFPPPVAVTPPPLASGA